MNILADENVDSTIVARLRDDGPHVLQVAEMEPGVSDDHVLARAIELGCHLLTEDKDCGVLVFRQALVHAGVILVRLAGLSGPGKAELVAQAVATHTADLGGAFAVVSPGAIRIRRAPFV